VRNGLLLVVPIMLGTFASASAQARGGAVELRAGAALGWARTSVAGESSTNFGPLLTGQLGFALSTRTDLTVDVAVQSFKAQNPVADEAFRGVYTLAGLQIGLITSRRVYLRPELGLVFRSWSGSQVFVSSETSPAAGLGIGGEIPIGRGLGLAPETFVRLSGAEELSTALVGVGISVVPVGARRRAQ
jgi:hypothetical protein